MDKALKAAAMMKAIVAQQGAEGVELSLMDMLYPHAAENDVIVRVHAASFTPGELDWPGTFPESGMSIAFVTNHLGSRLTAVGDLRLPTFASIACRLL
ncbi:putative zinc-binding oxidoreductase [Mycobacteroides stephanolepidis]|uniref:Putative zinc-binding oxidoreductase n=1 Tax=[Mycobacterium] stephanolepidis TaxID=1520670 RepID=A0A1Z4EXU6_9MYCO|nr:putative zinc-binding oxidoreductase [[Mycobacterium] stephanolepidis]